MSRVDWKAQLELAENAYFGPILDPKSTFLIVIF